MYQPLPTIADDLDLLHARLRRERDPLLRPRVHLLVLLKSGQVRSCSQAAAHLAVHRNTIIGWLRQYRHGGLEALLSYKEPGAPSGPKTLPPPGFAQLQEQWATVPGFASYVALPHWLREEFGLEVPYTPLPGIVRSQLKAKLKRPRPSHAKKTRRKRLTWSSSVHAASGRLQP